MSWTVDAPCLRLTLDCNPRIPFTFPLPPGLSLVCPASNLHPIDPARPTMGMARRVAWSAGKSNGSETKKVIHNIKNGNKKEKNEKSVGWTPSAFEILRERRSVGHVQQRHVHGERHLQSGGHVVEKRQTGKTVHDPRVHHLGASSSGPARGHSRGSRGMDAWTCCCCCCPRLTYGLYLPLDWLLGRGLGNPAAAACIGLFSGLPSFPEGPKPPSSPLPSVDHHAQAAVFQGLHLRYGVIVLLPLLLLSLTEGLGHLPKNRFCSQSGCPRHRVVLLASQLTARCAVLWSSTRPC